jgi:hypothetical protein
MTDSIEVRLTEDLTRYHPSLVPGVEGHTCGDSRLGDRFVVVRFPKTTLDILWKGLEIIDEEHLKKMAEYKKAEQERMKQATDVVRRVGPRGGFWSLSYKYGQGTRSTGSKQQAAEWEAFFKEHGISIREEREK